MTRSYFAYIRVSTVRQGEHGSSLQEQRDAIAAFARRSDAHIVKWFEERETAAKIGRREFTRMVVLLKKQKAAGVIFHKIDRSARNLKDWSAIQDLSDIGVDVRFAQESVNLASNEGKLTGDFLAVIAAHYIRNLREEVKKGMRGRLKQGIYPLGAPIGYLNQGGGKPKIPDPERAPHVRDAFEWYADGRYSLRALSNELYTRGFRTKSGKKVAANRLQKMLRNPFYIGIMRMRSGESYVGVHEPIVSKAVFDRVQRNLDGKKNAQAIVHDFLFRRMISCANCHYSLIGEKQKGYVYYRCHSKGCPTLTIREDLVVTAFRTRLQPLRFEEAEVAELRSMIAAHFDERSRHREEHIHALNLRLEGARARLSRLIDAYTDGMIDKSLFSEKKLSLLLEQKAIEDERDLAARNSSHFAEKLDGILERLKSLPLSYEIANATERQLLLQEITSNIRVDRKKLEITLRSPFQEIGNLSAVSICGLVRDRPRTGGGAVPDRRGRQHVRMKAVFDALLTYCNAASKNGKTGEFADLSDAEQGSASLSRTGAFIARGL
jgi:DNA invertase Pin-like site-specific DNA recombinase